MSAAPLIKPAPMAGDFPRKFLLPGDVYVAKEPTHISTVLGSCVGILLYDAAAGIGGMNHFLMDGAPGSSDVNPLRYAEPAFETLVARMIIAGARERNLVAKVFGGAQLSPRPTLAHLRIGERNIAAARELLREQGITVKASALGGTVGRKVIMESHTGNVWVKELRSG
ncbi:MAG: chemotaxis protein CheD [Chrysiogenetes bacterium]|nr:chemotaxis protein CheD [Chrysiogenetes bacterium]